MHTGRQVLQGRKVSIAAATFAIAAAVVTAGVIRSAPASAYALSGCKTQTGITIYNGAVISKYVTATQSGVNRWNAMPYTPLLTVVTSSAGARVRVTGLNSAQNYWAVTYGPCSGGVFTSQVTLEWNDTYSTSLTTTQLRMVATHELGHVQGLDHTFPASCSSTPTVMVQGEMKWKCSWGTEPWTDDVNGVKSLY